MEEVTVEEEVVATVALVKVKADKRGGEAIDCAVRMSGLFMDIQFQVKEAKVSEEVESERIVNRRIISFSQIRPNGSA